MSIMASWQPTDARGFMIISAVRELWATYRQESRVGLRSAAALLWLTCSVSATAQTASSSVRYSYQDGIHFLTTDLKDMGLRFQTVLANDVGGPADREHVASMAKRHGATAAINTDYFGATGIEGMAYINGKAVRDNTCRTSLAISARNEVDISPDHNNDVSSKYTVVGGGPLILRDGVPEWDRGGSAACAGCAPTEVVNGECFPGSAYWDAGAIQTAAAVTRDGRWLILAVTDRTVKPLEMARILAERGGYAGMKLDGGGSSAMFYNGTTIKAGRPVAEALLIVPRVPRLSSSATRSAVGESVEVRGTGFTPNRAVLLHLRLPGTAEVKVSSRLADDRGQVSHLIGTADFAAGTYELWAVDETTQLSSEAIRFEMMQQRISTAPWPMFGGSDRDTAAAYFEALMKADTEKANALATTPFSFDRKEILHTKEEIEKKHREIATKKGERKVPQYSVSIPKNAPELDRKGFPDYSVFRVDIAGGDEHVDIYVTKTSPARVIGFSD